MAKAPEATLQKATGKTKGKGRVQTSTDKWQVPPTPPMPLLPRFLDIFETDWDAPIRAMSIKGSRRPNALRNLDINPPETTGRPLNDREIQMVEFLKGTVLFDGQALCTKILVMEEWDWRYHDDQVDIKGAVARLRGPDRLIQHVAAAAAALDGIDLDETRSDFAPRRRMRDWLIVTKTIRQPWENRSSLLAAPIPAAASPPLSETQQLCGSLGSFGRRLRLRKLNPKEVKAMLFLREIIHRRHQLEHKEIMPTEAFEKPTRRGKLWEWAFDCLDALTLIAGFQTGRKSWGYWGRSN
ncbi:hypothetical protein AYL99_04280 [Fonsecaea erecta]|uniref:Uncharacterized protein n=1 Tax=Fonsecaea erecta TaxID=1367422 RepID=A0A178ZQL4_9EURO|nr:hypothetical protein AYL99_04280 [Fonsecaea erecta]OAP62077.1 hypothetical protein AYL99_04280 [Fonsecaea erecta]